MTKKITKKQWWMSIGIVFLLVVGLAGYIYSQNLTGPKDIGPKLEYLGEVNFGCSWEMGILTLGLCGNKEENHSYLFGTDMSEGEFASYFGRHSKEVEPIIDCYPSCRKVGVSLAVSRGDRSASVDYYSSAQEYLSGDDTAEIKTSKAHIVKINKMEYQFVKNSY